MIEWTHERYTVAIDVVAFALVDMVAHDPRVPVLHEALKLLMRDRRKLKVRARRRRR